MNEATTHAPIRLLLVEDDQDSGASLKHMIEKRGVSATWARSAEQALYDWTARDYDVIVADIRLHGMSGVDLLRHIREKDPDFPFLLLTGFDSLESAIQAVKLGANDYLLKPLDNIESLLRPVEIVVRHHRLQLHALAVEHDLKESERRLSTLMSNLAGMAYRCRNDRSRTMEFASYGCRELLGYEPTNLVNNQGVAYGDLIHPDNRQGVWADIQAAVCARTSFKLEYRVTTASGQEKWVWEQGRAVFDAEAKVEAIEGFIEDITERKRTEEAIHTLNAELDQRVRERTTQLEAANRELEAFSYSISHDLRAPLRSINGFTQIVLEESHGKLDEGTVQNLERVRAAAQRMGGMIESLLGLARVTQQTIRSEAVNLGQLAEGIVEEILQRDPGREVKFVIANGLVAWGDSSLLHLVLQNLLDNAWKFTSKRAQARIEFGVISVSDREARERAMRTCPVEAGGSPLLSNIFFVRDDGAGFDMNNGQKLFGAFQRLHSAAEYEGTGIGLATVRRIIQRHGGLLWAEGEVGKGATFYFSLSDDIRTKGPPPGFLGELGVRANRPVDGSGPTESVRTEPSHTVPT